MQTMNLILYNHLQHFTCTRNIRVNYAQPLMEKNQIGFDFRLKALKEPVYTQEEAEAAAGMGSYKLPPPPPVPMDTPTDVGLGGLERLQISVK